MIKKVSIIFIILITLCGCTKLTENDKLYKKDVKTLEKQTTFDKEFPFNINLTINKLTDYEITYRLIIDNFDKDINNIKAIVIHDKKTDNTYPSIGIYEDKVDLTKINKKGILLVGYIDYKKDIKDFKGTFKTMITYEKNGKEITKYYEKVFTI